MTLECRKCRCCKEILDTRDFSPKSTICRRCDSARTRAFRKTARYRQWRREHAAKPEVIEKRRERDRLRAKTRRCVTPREKLIRSRASAGCKARTYSRQGNDERAQHQWNRYLEISKELEKLKCVR